HVLDGTPLQLHWFIVKLRPTNQDVLGNCNVRGVIEVCSNEPAPGSSQCTDHQHGGIIVVDPE
ncbi:MAG: hypothetical protein NZM12_07800, partial [Steroidobacteraceae bacterium]|nr:hypothetical protein [Steroidobacteraceae bacterium]